MKRLLKRTLPLAILIVLAADLLYLYYAGAWHNTVKFIELVEVVILWALIPASIYLIIDALKGE